MDVPSCSRYVFGDHALFPIFPYFWHLLWRTILTWGWCIDMRRYLSLLVLSSLSASRRYRTKTVGLGCPSTFSLTRDSMDGKHPELQWLLIPGNIPDANSIRCEISPGVGMPIMEPGLEDAAGNSKPPTKGEQMVIFVLCVEGTFGTKYVKGDVVLVVEVVLLLRGHEEINNPLRCLCRNSLSSIVVLRWC